MDPPIYTAWLAAHDLHPLTANGSGQGPDVAEGSIDESEKMNVDIASPNEMPQILQDLVTNDNRHDVEQAVKQVAMQWYWNGYYQGFDHGRAQH